MTSQQKAALYRKRIREAFEAVEAAELALYSDDLSDAQLHTVETAMASAVEFLSGQNDEVL
jgi:hypothetical protein